MLHPHAAVRFHCETSEFSFVSFTGAYYCLNMIMITLSTFLSVIVINLYFRGDKRNRVPRWLKIVSSICISEMLTVCEVWFSAKYTQLSSNTISPSPNNSPEGIFRPKRTTGKSTALDFERLLFWLLQKKKEKKKKETCTLSFFTILVQHSGTCKRPSATPPSQPSKFCLHLNVLQIFIQRQNSPQQSCSVQKNWQGGPITKRLEDMSKFLWCLLV